MLLVAHQVAAQASSSAPAAGSSVQLLASTSSSSLLPPRLQPGLVRGFANDFVLVPPRVWRALSSWYGTSGPPVRRNVISTQSLRLRKRAASAGGAGAGAPAGSGAAGSLAAEIELYPIVVRAQLLHVPPALTAAAAAAVASSAVGSPLQASQSASAGATASGGLWPWASASLTSTAAGTLAQPLSLSASGLPTKAPTLLPIYNSAAGEVVSAGGSGEADAAATPASTDALTSLPVDVFMFSRADRLSFVRETLARAARRDPAHVRLWRAMPRATQTALAAGAGSGSEEAALLSIFPFSPLWGIEAGIDGDDSGKVVSAPAPASPVADAGTVASWDLVASAPGSARVGNVLPPLSDGSPLLVDCLTLAPPAQVPPQRRAAAGDATSAGGPSLPAWASVVLRYQAAYDVVIRAVEARSLGHVSASRPTAPAESSPAAASQPQAAPKGRQGADAAGARRQQPASGSSSAKAPRMR